MCDLGQVTHEFWKSMAECDIGVLQLCWCPDEIEDIDLVKLWVGLKVWFNLWDTNWNREKT